MQRELYMRFKCINLKFRPKYLFLSVYVFKFSFLHDIFLNMTMLFIIYYKTFM